MIHYTLTTSSEYAFTHAAIVARFLEDEDVPDSEMAQVLATILGELLFQLRDDAVHEPNYEMWITTVRGAEPWDLVLRQMRETVELIDKSIERMNGTTRGRLPKRTE